MAILKLGGFAFNLCLILVFTFHILFSSSELLMSFIFVLKEIPLPFFSSVTDILSSIF